MAAAAIPMTIPLSPSTCFGGLCRFVSPGARRPLGVMVSRAARVQPRGTGRRAPSGEDRYGR